MVIELSPDIEARLTAEARAHGLGPEQYAQRLLQDVLGRPEAGSGKLTTDDLNLMLRQMAEGSENLPPLPTSAFGRESFYEGRL